MNTKTGALYLARQLEDYGVTHVFMVPAILRRTLVEMEMLTSINRLHVHSEKTAVYMADGFARAAGTHQRHGLAPGDGHIELLEYRITRRVGKPHIGKANLTCGHRQGFVGGCRL